MNEIHPCLWFNGQAVEAANFYVSVFPNSKVLQTTYYGEDMMQPAGTVLTVNVELNGCKVMILNGGPHFTLSPAVSLVVPCDDQAELDRMWDALLEGGKASQCGWLEDRYGVSWQIVPRLEKIFSEDQAANDRVMQAVMKMVKLDIAAMEKAKRGE